MPEESKNPFERIKISELKDHELREMVNELTNTARLFANTQQLRERVAGIMIKHLRPFKAEELRATDADATAELTSNFLVEDDLVIDAVHIERRTTRLSDDDIDRIAYTSDGESMKRMLTLMDAYPKAQRNAEALMLFARYRKEERKEAIEAALALLRR